MFLGQAVSAKDGRAETVVCRLGLLRRSIMAYNTHTHTHTHARTHARTQERARATRSHDHLLFRFGHFKKAVACLVCPVYEYILRLTCCGTGPKVIDQLLFQVISDSHSLRHPNPPHQIESNQINLYYSSIWYKA